MSLVVLDHMKGRHFDQGCFIYLQCKEVSYSTRVVPFSLIWHEWFHHMSVLGIARLHFDLFFLFLFVDFCDDVRIGWCRDGGY